MHDLSITVETSSAAGHPSLFSNAREKLTVFAEAAEILDDVRAAMKRSPEGAHAAALRLVMLFTQPAAATPEIARGGLAPWQKRKLEQYLREHLERPLPVKKLAEQVSLSASHFCRAFKGSFGITPHMYIVRLRLELAQQLMCTTEDSLSDISLACGLADQAHLSKLFRRWIGVTPRAWRRENFTEVASEARSSRPVGKAKHRSSALLT